MLREVWLLGGLSKDRDIEVFVQVADLLKYEKVKILLIKIKVDGNKMNFDGIIAEDLDEYKAKKLLFRTTRHRRFYSSITDKITFKKKELSDLELIKEKLEKIFNRWKNWFKKAKDIPLAKEDKDFLKNLKKLLFNKKAEILDELASEVSQLGSQLRTRIKTITTIISIKIVEDNSEKYIGDIKVFRDVFKFIVLNEYLTRYGIKYHGKKSICILCNSKKEVAPLSPFPIFTVDKMGFAYELMREYAWKQLPICIDCFIKLESGKRILEEKFRYDLIDGLFYYVIPSAIDIYKFKSIMKVFLTKLDRIEVNEEKDILQTAGELINAEDYITSYVIHKQYELLLTYVFCKRKTGGYFDVVGYAADVPPSWLRKIHMSLNAVSKDELFSESSLKKLLGKDWVGNLIRSEHIISRARTKRGRLGVLFYFIQLLFDQPLIVLIRILSRRKIAEKYVFKAFNRKLRNAFIKDSWEGTLLTLISFFLYLFLIKLGVLTMISHHAEPRVKNMSEELLTKDNIDSFFTRYNVAFTNASRRASFLVGVFVKFLLDVQYAQRKETPFWSKLYTLRLNVKRLKKIFTEAVNKLHEYGITYKELQQRVAQELVAADNESWDITDDEISYFFTLGLSLGALFKKRKEEKSE